MSNKKSVSSSKKSFPVWTWIVLGVILLAAAGIMVMKLLQPAASASLPAEVTIVEAAQMRDQGAFILDVREPDEWVEVHIPDATLIPLGDLPSRLAEIPRDREVVVVCRSGNRSARGRDILLNAGFTNVTSMAGGMAQWQAQDLPVATGE